MATFTIETTSGSNLASFYRAFLNAFPTLQGVTATEIGFSWGPSPPDNLVLTGSGFIPGETPLVSGTVTGISFHDDFSIDYASVSGFSFGPALFLDEFDGGTYQSLLDFLGSGHHFIGNSGADVITCGSGDDTAEGGGGRDILMGFDRDDTLYGGGGRDVLRGDVGYDYLDGGSGADRFKYRSPLEGNDTLAAFNQNDVVVINAQTFGGSLLPGQKLINGQDFISGKDPVAIERTGTFLYDIEDKTLSWDEDGSGAGAPVLIFTIFGTGAITVDDFRFY